MSKQIWLGPVRGNNRASLLARCAEYIARGETDRLLYIAASHPLLLGAYGAAAVAGAALAAAGSFGRVFGNYGEALNGDPLLQAFGSFNGSGSRIGIASVRRMEAAFWKLPTRSEDHDKITGLS